MIKNVLQITRTLAVELSPPILDHGGIVEAAQWLAEHMSATQGFAVTVESEGNCQVIDRNQRMLLFQILRELLFNVVKHAGVDRASVRFRGDGTSCTFVVSDQGKGFVMNSPEKSDNRPTGFGLSGLGERLHMVGGALVVQSAPGQGTQITVTLPLLGLS